LRIKKKSAMISAPIIIVDEDEDDHAIVKEIAQELNLNLPLVFFKSGEALLKYLKSGKQTPFIIISEVNLPGMDGFKLREKILKDSSAKYKSIPFIFWSAGATEAQVRKAYDLASHGFFIKGTSMDGMKEVFSDIIAYWEKSETPENIQ